MGTLPQPRVTQTRASTKLAVIPAGWFCMGSESGQDNERPVHRVWVDTFELGDCQVTNAEYAEFLKATGTQAPPFWGEPNFNHPQQPVVGISWFEAVRYCDWLRDVSDKPIRLPSEAEWERAARGGAEGRLFPWGNDPPESLPNYASRWKSGPEPVAHSPANEYRLYDICENVHEWCSDWYQADYYSVSPARNPRGPQQGERRASRGGSWRHHVKVTRCSARSSIPPHLQYADYGFRVACDRI